MASNFIDEITFTHSQVDKFVKRAVEKERLRVMGVEESRLARVREFVEYPGNWSTLDGRRRILLAMLDGQDAKWER